MKRYARMTLLAIAVLCSSPAAFAAGDYVIGEGDLLVISVWGEQQLGQTVRVRPDGKITLLALGDSLMAGYGLQPSDAFPVKLEAAVRARGHGVEVIKGGGAGGTAGGVYVNFMPDDEAQRVRSGAYGPNYERLTRVKAKYDPANLYRMNQNVAPAAKA